jgi:diguanylate cyclase (GGDEF)-like protein
VVLADAEPGEALELAERLRREVAALRLTTASGGPLRVTISIGVAQLDARVRTKTDLIAAADAVLYAAKAAGKYRVATTGVGALT